MNEIVLTTNGRLSEETLKALKAKLAAKFGCDVFRLETDKSIIGGFTVRYNGTFYDVSVSSRLDSLRKYVEATEADK